jgi:hypothetical protein
MNMEQIRVIIKNKSSMDCWVYVGATDVYYLLAKSKISIKVMEGENLYAVSNQKDIKLFGVITHHVSQINIFF